MGITSSVLFNFIEKFTRIILFYFVKRILQKVGDCSKLNLQCKKKCTCRIPKVARIVTFGLQGGRYTYRASPLTDSQIVLTTAE